MDSDMLYKLAFEYKKTKLWNILSDIEVFAVKLSGERIGYINIMGFSGGPRALGLYVGEERFNSFRRIALADPQTLTTQELQERILHLDCLQCSFENKDALNDEELEAARAYAHSHDIRIAGKKAYPLFQKYMPNRFPCPLQSENEQKDLCEALAAAIEVARLLDGKKPADLGLGKMIDASSETILLEYKDQEYSLGKIMLPEEYAPAFPTPTARNEIGLASLKKMKKSGIWECAIIRFPQPVQGNPDEPPFFPMLLLAVESSTGYMLNVPPIMDYDNHPEDLLNTFMQALLEEKIRPIRLKARDERTYAFAEAFCKKLKIPLSMDEDLPTLADAEEDFLMRFGMEDEEQLDEIEALLDKLLELDESQFHTIPAEIMDLLESLEEQELLPGHLAEKLNRILHPQPYSLSKSAPARSFLISVSLEPGCYRHIQISGSDTLLELHTAILDAFGFVDDHAHAFFMDNISWSDADSYYAEGLEPGLRITRKYTLDKARFHKGMHFKYVFDFGDEWTFQCKVLRVLDENTDEPMVIKSKGDNPEQYPDWDGE